MTTQNIVHAEVEIVLCHEIVPLLNPVCCAPVNNMFESSATLYEGARASRWVPQIAVGFLLGEVERRISAERGKKKKKKERKRKKKHCMGSPSIYLWRIVISSGGENHLLVIITVMYESGLCWPTVLPNSTPTRGCKMKCASSPSGILGAGCVVHGSVCPSSSGFV